MVVGSTGMQRNDFSLLIVEAYVCFNVYCDSTVLYSPTGDGGIHVHIESAYW
jgi:hypothetical protein